MAAVEAVTSSDCRPPVVYIGLNDAYDDVLQRIKAAPVMINGNSHFVLYELLYNTHFLSNNSELVGYTNKLVLMTPLYCKCKYIIYCKYIYQLNDQILFMKKQDSHTCTE